MNNFFFVTKFIHASTGSYKGTGVSRSIKSAVRQAEISAWDALAVGDAKANFCSGIGSEWMSVTRNGVTVSEWDF